jgi:lipopolysaccharide biosynthesis glycosyltransferase
MIKNKTMKKSQPNPKSLMASSESKKRFAAEQEKIGKAQIKNKVKEGSMGYDLRYGGTIPVGKQRLKLAKDMMLSAKLDSLQSVRMSKKMSKKK